jgi:hypothetical protein
MAARKQHLCDGQSSLMAPGELDSLLQGVGSGSHPVKLGVHADMVISGPIARAVRGDVRMKSFNDLLSRGPSYLVDAPEDPGLRGRDGQTGDDIRPTRLLDFFKADAGSRLVASNPAEVATLATPLAK